MQKSHPCQWGKIDIVSLPMHLGKFQSDQSKQIQRQSKYGFLFMDSLSGGYIIFPAEGQSGSTSTPLESRSFAGLTSGFWKIPSIFGRRVTKLPPCQWLPWQRVRSEEGKRPFVFFVIVLFTGLPEANWGTNEELVNSSRHHLPWDISAGSHLSVATTWWW